MPSWSPGIPERKAVMPPPIFSLATRIPQADYRSHGQDTQDSSRLIMTIIRPAVGMTIGTSLFPHNIDLVSDLATPNFSIQIFMYHRRRTTLTLCWSLQRSKTSVPELETRWRSYMSPMSSRQSVRQSLNSKVL